MDFPEKSFHFIDIVELFRNRLINTCDVIGSIELKFICLSSVI